MNEESEDALPGAPLPAGTDTTRCGFVALVGAPNAGKSTLMNTLVGAKVSIVSPKVQTTRSRVIGIAMEGDAQIVFVDTPGIFQNPKRRLERAMVAAAWSGAGDADAVVVLVDADRGISPDTSRLLEQLVSEDGTGKRPLILALNKIDLIKRDTLLALVTELHTRAKFVETFMISATTGDGVADLRKGLAALVPAGPWAYPDDQLADLPLRLLAAEFTREQLFRQLHEELPYSLMVETETWTEKEDGSVRIDQVVTIQRESQRKIVLGKGGRQIRSVGEASRKELSKELDRPVHLFLHVKVRENWQDDPDAYRLIGLDYQS